MQSQKNYFDSSGISMHVPKKKNVEIKPQKKSRPLSSPAAAPIPIFYPTQITPLNSFTLPPLIEPPKPVYPKFN